jgi:hypothetical protein
MWKMAILFAKFDQQCFSRLACSAHAMKRLTELCLRVPTSEQKQHAGKEGALEEANEETEHIKLGRVLHASLSECEHPPQHFH